MTVGMNFWQAMWLGAEPPVGDPGRLDRELDRIAGLGASLVRIFACGEGPADAPERVVPPLQPDPGEHDERLLAGLDRALAAIAARRMRAIVCLGNFWHWSGGLAQYLAWADGAPTPWPLRPSPDFRAFARHAARFYESAGARSLYARHVERIVARTSALTGIRYCDDATIAAFELANEPRGADAPHAMRAWLAEEAAHVRSIAPERAVASGSEGSTADPALAGLDFAEDHADPAVGIATCHLWPENWELWDPAADDDARFDEMLAWARGYVRHHAVLAAKLGKPLLVEELGLARDGGSLDPTAPVGRRDRFFAAVLDEARTLTAEGLPILGVLPWAWSGEARPGAPFGGDPPHEPQGWYGILTDDRTTLEVLARGGRLSP